MPRVRLRRRDVPAVPKAEKNEAPPIDVGPRVVALLAQVKKHLAEMPANERPAPVAYEFEILRDQRGYLKKIIARPLPAKSQN